MQNISMSLIGKFMTKVSQTSDKKKLKKGIKNYDYGTISIRRQELAKHIGEEVEGRVYGKNKEKKREEK